MSAPIYYRFKHYENKSDNFTIIEKTKNDMSNMKKWELLELRKQLQSSVRVTLNNYYQINSQIRKYLRKIKKEEKRIYQKKKEREYYD